MMMMMTLVTIKAERNALQTRSSVSGWTVIVFLWHHDHHGVDSDDGDDEDDKDDDEEEEEEERGLLALHLLWLCLDN